MNIYETDTNGAGMFRAEDMSETLSRKGFWSSANVATFPEVRRLVGETNSVVAGKKL